MRIGITGGIGSGKTYVCDKLVKAGFPVYSCDAEAKRLMVEDISIIESLKGLVGEDVYDSQGALCKERMIAFLFSDKGNTEKVNSIVHPAVKADFLKWASLQNSDKVFMESAILFESGFDDVVDCVVDVYAPADVRLARAVKRDSSTSEAVSKRMASQMDDEEKKRLADYCIVNDGIEDVDTQIEKLIALLGLF